MPAAVLEVPGRLRVRDIPIFPYTSPDQVRIRVAACGVCGSDLRYLRGENPWALHTLGEERPNPPNIVLGHEYSGEVVDVADRENEDLLGRRVGIVCFKTCGRCTDCRSGQENLCKNTIHVGHGQGWGRRDFYPGAYARYTLGWAQHCYPLPDHVTFEDAAMLDILSVGLHVARRGQISRGEPILCIGAGPAGNAIMQVAKLEGASRAIVADISPTARRIAEACGADVVIDPSADDLVEAVLRETGREGCGAVFDSVGTQDTIRAGLRVLAGGGTLVNMALHAGPISFDGLAIGGERTIRSSSNNRIEDFQIALRYLAAGRFRVRPWITHRFPLGQIQQAFDLLVGRREETFKVLILPD